MLITDWVGHAFSEKVKKSAGKRGVRIIYTPNGPNALKTRLALQDKSRTQEAECRRKADAFIFINSWPIDDFGRKHSNLDRLWRLAPEFVKLDKGIIQEAERNSRVRKALPNLVAVIRDLGAQPVIKGIETQAQLNIAIETGGTLLQGYFLGKPLVATELQHFQWTIQPVIKVAA